MGILCKYKYKNIKTLYYIKNISALALPRWVYRARCPSLLSQLGQYDYDYVMDRVGYYNKKKTVFSVSDAALALHAFKKIKKKTYFFDLYPFFSSFPVGKKLDYIFGDVTIIPDTPSIVKSRPIAGDNENSVVMKLDKVRHFHFIEDDRRFIDKKNSVVWRGAVKQPHRKRFVRQWYNAEAFDIGQTKPVEDVPWFKGFLSIYDQLAHKFIFCIEGFDVATNLKWAMSSNSVCVMPKPKFETWFMEGRLQAGVHYIEVKDDCSDLEEKVAYYSEHTDEALEIIENAHAYVDQFRDSRREKLISLLVLEKYFRQSRQL